MEILLIFLTCADKNEAKHIVGTLVAENLIACGLVLAPTESHYVWEGKTEWTTEVPLLLKTLPEREAAVRARLSTLHSYTTPALLSWRATAAPAFADWVRMQVGSDADT